MNNNNNNNNNNNKSFIPDVVITLREGVEAETKCLLFSVEF